MEDVQFTINRDNEGRANGFTLMGVGRSQSEAFCLSFLTAQRLGKGQVVFEDGKIIFRHGGVSLEEADSQMDVFGMHEGGEHSEDISEEDSTMLSALLHQSGPYQGVQIRVRPELAWGKGFTLFIKE
jgi:hypothetical protein